MRNNKRRMTGQLYNQKQARIQHIVKESNKSTDTFLIIPIWLTSLVHQIYRYVMKTKRQALHKKNNQTDKENDPLNHNKTLPLKDSKSVRNLGKESRHLSPAYIKINQDSIPKPNTARPISQFLIPVTTPRPWLRPQAEYSEEIFNHLLSLENKYSIDVRKLPLKYKNQREDAVQYILKAYSIFSLKKETVYLCVYYLDKFMTLQKDTTSLSLSLVLQACLLLSTKYSEIYPPEMESYVDKKHFREVIKIESDMLEALDFQLCYFSPLEFYFYWQETFGLAQNQQKISLLLLDISLFHPDFYRYSPALISYCAADISRKMVRGPAFQENANFFSVPEKLQCCRLFMGVLHSSIDLIKHLIKHEHNHPELISLLKRV